MEEAGPGDLPNLLRQLKGKTTPTQTPPPPQTSPMEAGNMPPPASPIKIEESYSNEDPVIVMVGGLESRPALSATPYGDHKMDVMPI